MTMTCYMGKGASKAVVHINKTISPALVSKELSVVEQEKMDKLMIKMIGTGNKYKFGANDTLGVSSGCLQRWCCGKGSAPLPSHH